MAQMNKADSIRDIVTIDPFVHIDSCGVILSANEACCNCFGYSSDELVGKNISLLMPEPYASQHAKYISNYLETGVRKVVPRVGRKLPGLKSDGTTFPMFLTLTEIFNEEKGTQEWIGIMRNLSAELEGEQLLNAMKNLVESSMDPIVQISCDGTIRLANPACCKCFQYEREELVGNNISMLMPEPFASKHSQFIQNYLITGEAKVVEQGRRGRSLPGMRKDGTTFPMFLTLSEATLNGEKVFNGIMRSLSAEEEERQVLKAMIDSCVDPIVVITNQGVIERCNPACTEVFGYTKEELLGHSVTILMPNNHATHHQSYLDKYMASNRRKRAMSGESESYVVGKGRNVTGQRKDGSTFPILLTVSEFEVSSTNSNRHGFIGIMRDMEDKERAATSELEREKSEALLMNVLPHHICQRLKAQKGQECIQIADNYENVSICFADIVGFTQFASDRTPMQVVHYLNKVFRDFDMLVDKYNLEKIKTIGDAYMAVGGLDGSTGNHTYKMILFALDMLDAVNRLNAEISKDDDGGNNKFGIRVGLHTGSVVAGVVGTKRRFFDLWGDAVNIASRMESSGIENCIHCTSAVATEAIKYPNEFIVISRGSLEVKGKGLMNTFVLAPTAKEKVTRERLQEHKATRRRESYMIHKRLAEEFDFNLEEGKKSSTINSSLAFFGAFLLGIIVSYLALKMQNGVNEL